ncbi:MAG: hypothetical protein H7Y01_07895 [Ferruginibacter sp.]|nr:hypothetical protein [Chitinophagaceae bacterium]
MSKTIFLYGASSVFIIAGMLLIRTGLKKESISSEMMKVNYVPTKNYGKFFQIALGLLCVIIGIALLVTKNK